MIFTIGHTESYERYFLEQEKPMKKGRCFDYVGGSVWKNREEALDFIRNNGISNQYSVYGVIADWDKDTVISEENSYRDLLIDAELVRVG